MKLTILKAVCIMVFIFSSNLYAATISKEMLMGVPADKKDQIFGAFANVPLYYLVYANGDGIADVYSQESPDQFPAFFPSPPKGPVVTLYYNSGIAEEFRRIQVKKSNEEVIIRTATLERILHGQYEQLKSDESSGDQTAFVVVDNPFRISASVEILIDEVTGEPYTMQDGDYTFIPAFIASNLIAIDYQNALADQGKKYTRVGITPFSEFLKLVEEKALTETPIAVFYGARSQ